MATSNGTNPTITVNNAAGDTAVVMNTSASGNLSFEVVLSPARAVASPRAAKLQSPMVASSPRSLEDIAAKMKAAEENRERLIDEKLEKIKEHEKRHTDAMRKMSEEMEVEGQRILEQSKSKLAMAEELRQQRMEHLKEKLKEHDNHIEEVRKRIATKGDLNGEDLQRELDDATATREMVADVIQEKQQENGTAQNGNAKENLIP